MLLPRITDQQIDPFHPVILEESAPVLFGMLTAMTLCQSWEALNSERIAQFLAHEATGLEISGD